MIKVKNKEFFADNLISKLLENGFDFMKERELKVYILYLLLEDGQFVNEKGELDFHEMSLVLKITETKVRNLVYEVELKYQSNINFIKKVIELIEKNKFEIDGEKIKFAVHDPLLKQHFEYEIRKLDAISDGSFAKHIVTISKSTFEKLLIRFYGNSNKIQEIIQQLPEEKRKQLSNKENFFKEFVKEFFMEFGKGFGNEFGRQSADLIFSSLGLVNVLKNIFPVIKL